MANTKTYDSFLFRASWWQNIKMYPNTMRGQIMESLCQYVFEGIEPEFDPMSSLSTAIHFIKADVDNDKAKYNEVCAKRSEAGKRGNEMRWGEKSQSVAKIANATSQSQSVANVADKNMNKNTNNNSIEEEKTEKVKDKSFSFSEKKEKIIFAFALLLLSEGRPNAYREARDAYNYNDSTDWTTETTKPNGDVVKKKIANKLAWLNGWKRTNEQIFAPADGTLYAEFFKGFETISTQSECVINHFRGIQFDDEETIVLLFTTNKAIATFKKAFDTHANFKQKVCNVVQSKYPKTTTIQYKTV